MRLVGGLWPSQKDREPFVHIPEVGGGDTGRLRDFGRRVLQYYAGGFGESFVHPKWQLAEGLCYARTGFQS